LTSLRRTLKRRRVKRALDKAYERTRRVERPLDIRRDRMVIFSDHHKGARDPADDFWRCEAAYRAALGFYLELGFTLVVLGDVEELWEATAEVVLEEYEETLRLEGAFATDDNGYERVWGNHDPDWSQGEEATTPLVRALGLPGPLPVHEALHIHVTAGTESLGKLFLVHGHQGTLSSDGLARVSKPLVRHLWANVQRRIDRPWNTPARDGHLRGAHDRTMFEWAERHPDRPVLIAGHTHRPVFRAAEREAPDIPRLEQELASVPNEPERRLERAEKRMTLEAARARLRTTPDLRPVQMRTPCYFNTGCASFGDGSVTALEIADAEIRLVRWPWPYGDQQPRREPMDSSDLEEVFAAVRGDAER
jgi:predicted phosphodiesterase